MLKLTMLGGAAVLFLAALSTPAGATDSTPPPNRVAIDVVTVNGSGCKPGSAVVSQLPDNTAFTVMYSDYLVQVGSGSTPTEFRKNCQINLHVHVPQGFTYAIAKAVYTGFAHLEQGATGLQRANYYFQGQSQTVAINHPLRGPFDDDWQNTDTTDVASLVYLPCGEDRNLNINTELRVKAGSSDPENTTSFMTMDSTRGSVKTIYHFHWKHCP